ncbi:hypothetical protein AAFF_G00239330, partial [Aldrovandia affinis]
SSEGNQTVIIELIFNSIFVVSWFSKYKEHELHTLYEHRIDIQEDGSIRMNNVQLSDSGLYHIQIHDMSDFKPTKYSRFHLQVFECVSKPNITAECRRNNISLSCSSIRGNDVTYSWETLPPVGNGSCVHLGQTMELYPLPPTESTTYTCTAQNPVSRATSDPIDLGVCSIQQPRECVSKPNITAECRRNNISLSCSSIRGNDVTYSSETLPPVGNGSCVHLGQTMEIYPLPPTESTTYTCTAQNPVSRATSDPIDLGVCSIQQPRDGRWVPALCGLSALFLIGLLIFLYKRNH